EELCGIIEPQAQAKGLIFRINKDGPLPARVYTDGKRLRQVLINLLINAIKYSDRGSVLLRVEPFGGNDVRVELRFSVIDNGPGIRLEKQQEIFEAFRRIEVAQEGVGLGLCICRQLVGLMGGQLNLDSQPGLGSRFWFKLEFERCEWPVSAQSERNSDASPHPEFEVPPLLELETALELAQDEDWERLSEWSTDLVDGQPGFDTFAVRLEELTASGDPEVIVEWLRGFVPER
ncbi:MAG: ATP-binding protein, partial [Gammaproteobacteria bacterium]